MYYDSVVIATKADHADLVESVLPYSYSKEEKNNCVYYSMDEVSWHSEFLEEVDKCNSTVQTLPEQEWAFVRMSNEIGDVEVHGNVEDFNIKISTRIEY